MHLPHLLYINLPLSFVAYPALSILVAQERVAAEKTAQEKANVERIKLDVAVAAIPHTTPIPSTATTKSPWMPRKEPPPKADAPISTPLQASGRVLGPEAAARKNYFLQMKEKTQSSPPSQHRTLGGAGEGQAAEQSADQSASKLVGSMRQANLSWASPSPAASSSARTTGTEEGAEAKNRKAYFLKLRDATAGTSSSDSVRPTSALSSTQAASTDSDIAPKADGFTTFSWDQGTPIFLSSSAAEGDAAGKERNQLSSLVLDHIDNQESPPDLEKEERERLAEKQEVATYIHEEAELEMRELQEKEQTEREQQERELRKREEREKEAAVLKEEVERKAVELAQTETDTDISSPLGRLRQQVRETHRLRVVLACSGLDVSAECDEFESKYVPMLATAAALNGIQLIYTDMHWEGASEAILGNKALDTRLDECDDADIVLGLLGMQRPAPCPEPVFSQVLEKVLECIALCNIYIYICIDRDLKKLYSKRLEQRSLV